MNKKQEMICFDLETLGNNNRSPIIQIGAVKFNLIDGIYDEFHRNVCYPFGIPDKYECDYSTIMWWLQQDKEAIELLFPEQETLYTALHEFLNWADIADDKLFWSMENFDAPILQHAILCELSQEYQIPFRNFRDFRTVADIAGLERASFDGIKHCALHDAQNEAHAIIKSLNKLL